MTGLTVEQRDGVVVVSVDRVERITYVGEPDDEALREMVREVLGDDAAAAVETQLSRPSNRT